MHSLTLVAVPSEFGSAGAGVYGTGWVDIEAYATGYKFSYWDAVGVENNHQIKRSFSQSNKTISAVFEPLRGLIKSKMQIQLVIHGGTAIGLVHFGTEMQIYGFIMHH